MTEETTASATEREVTGEFGRRHDELVMFLEYDQLSEATARPLPRARITRRLSVGLWALRVFVTLLSIMVVYAFIVQLK